jgi:leucyl aminopeptidase (aminopeptidase T)
MVPADVWHKREPPKMIAEAMKHANIIFYSGSPDGITWVYGDARMEAGKRGAKSMSNIFCVDAILHVGKTDPNEIKKYVKVAEKVLNEAKRFRLVTKGCELTGSLGRKCYPMYPIAEPPYNAGTFAGAEAMMAPLEGTAEGTIYVDGAIGGGIGPVGTPVVVTVEKGLFVKAEGGKEADMLNHMILEQYGYDKGARFLCEFSIGCHPSARTGAGVSVHEWKNLLGTVHIAFGDNHGFGGHPDTAGKIVSDLHVDCLTLKPTLELDGKVVISSGKLLVQ